MKFQVVINKPLPHNRVYTKGVILKGPVPEEGKFLKPSQAFNIVKGLYGLSHKQAKEAGLRRDVFHMGGTIVLPNGKTVIVKRVWGIWP